MDQDRPWTPAAAQAAVAHPDPVRGAAARVWATLLGLLGLGLLGAVPLHASVLEVTASLSWRPDSWRVRHGVGVLALGISPYLSAALLVEVVALLVPRWRTLREHARGTLERRAVQVSFVLAAVQAFFLARWLESSLAGGAAWQPQVDVAVTGPLFTVSVSAALVAGYALALTVVRLLGRRGLVHGVTAWMAGVMVVEVLDLVSVAVGSLREVGAAKVFQGVLVVVGPLVAFGFVLRRPHALAPAGAPVVRLPPSGVGALSLAGVLSTLAVTLHNLGVTVPGSGLLLRPTAATQVVVASVVLGWLFTRGPFNAAALVGLGAGNALTRTRWRAVAMGTVVLTLLVLVFQHPARHALEDVGLKPAPLSVLLLGVAALLDVHQAFLAWSRRRDWTVVAEFQRVLQADAAAAALRVAGIETVLGNIHTRTALQWLGPYVAVEMLVPRGDASRAHQVLVTLANGAVHP